MKKFYAIIQGESLAGPVKPTLATILFLLMTVAAIPQNHFTESFENPDSWSGYTTETVTFDSGDWDFVEVYPESSTRSYDGSKACRINDDKAGASITSPAVDGVGTITFYYHKPFKGSGSFEVQKSVGGAPFTTLATVDYTSVTSPTPYSYDVNDASNNIKIRIVNDDNTAHLTIDYFEMGSYSGGGSTKPSISSISHSPAAPTSAETVSVTANVTDADGIFGVELHWGTIPGSLGNTISMSNTSGNMYEADTDIPVQPAGTTVYYEIYALDNNAEDSISAEYSYSVLAPSLTVTIHEEDFSNCAATQWIEESVSSDADWSCGSGVFEINAYGSSAAAGDYLISPAFNLDDYSNEELSFQSWTRYSDAFHPAVEILYTGNYTGNPSTTSWNTIAGATFPAQNSQSWASSGILDISGISGTDIRFAFKYTSSGTGGGSSSHWKINDILIEGQSAPSSSVSLSISDDGSITEGNEDSEQITVSISGDTLAATLDITNWTFSNLPSGVSVSNLSRTNDTAAVLTLSGNASRDYDNNITDFTVEIAHQEFKNLSSGSVSVASGVTFTATNDAESISMSDDGLITEGSEDGEVINVTLSGGTFADPLSAANWRFSGQPAGVSVGSVNRISATQAAVTLSGNASSDYDTNITNAELQIDASEIDDHSGADITTSSGITFMAVIEPAPGVQASDISFSNIGSTSVDVSWTRGNGEKVLLLVSGTTRVDSLPEDGMDYTADSEIPLGDTIGIDEYVAYKGTGTTATISGLLQGTRYHFRLFEFNNSGSATRYHTSSAPLNPDSVVTIPNNITNFSVDCISKTTADLSWTPPTGVYEGFVIAVREDINYPHQISGRGDTISADTVFGNGYEFGLTNPKSYVIYNGNGNQVSVSGLNPGMEYTFKAYTYNGTYWSSGTTKTPQLTEMPEVSNVAHYAPSNKMNITWNNPVFSCVDEVMVVVRQSNPVTGTPGGDGSAYTSSSVYGSGAQIVPNEYVVYKGKGNNVEITNLINDTTYYFKIFVRDGTEWSDGIEGNNTPDDITILFPGDLAVVAINTNYKTSGGGADEISMVAFDTIKSNTSIDFTDNGWERGNPDKWGNTEGTIRFTRTGPEILPGQVFTFRGEGHSPGDFSGHGLPDNSWTVTSLNGNYNFNLNSSDQIWVMQYGNWNQGTNNGHDATYSGNILYGWTATGWAGDPAHGSPGNTNFSELYPNTTCFNTNVVNTSYSDKVKYTGPTSPATRRTWILRINNPDNWTGYDNNGTNPGEYGHASTPQYTSGVTFTVLPDTLEDGEWVGDRDTNWYYCGNWGNLNVPDENTNVFIRESSQRNAVISTTSEYSDEFNDTAWCYSLSIEQDSLLLKSSADILNIIGDLSIDGGVLAPGDGTLKIRGDWLNQTANGFATASSKIYFNGVSQQHMTNTAGTETFHRLFLDNSSDLRIHSPLQTDSLAFINGRLFINDFNLRVHTGIRGADQARYIVNKNDAASGGHLLMHAANGSTTLFPVGTSSSYTPVSIKSNGAATEFRVRTYDSLLENGYSGNAISGKIVNRSWVAELVSAPSADVDIQLQWNITDENAGFGPYRNSAMMIQNPGTGSGKGWHDWNVIPGSSTVTGSGPFTIQSSGVANFGVFGISDRCELLKPNTSLIYHF